jgi:hypothetical protein
VLGIAVTAFAGFVGYQILATARPAPVDAVTVDSALVSTTVGGDVIVRESGLPVPQRDVEAIRRRLRNHGSGTYIDELLAARDSSIARWADRRADPIRVWIDERPNLAEFNPSLPSEVRRAFAGWGAAGAPLAFTFVPDSARSEVRVRFVERFNGRMSGRTLWERDPNWWIVGGTIELSLHSGTGAVLTPDQFHAVALHEVGHLLGLDHTLDSTAVMAPSIRTLALAPRDVATLRLIYGVPPGPIGSKDP